VRSHGEFVRELIEGIRNALGDRLLTGADNRATVTDGCAILRYSRLTLTATPKRRFIECRLPEPAVASGRLYFFGHRSGLRAVEQRLKMLPKTGAACDNAATNLSCGNCADGDHVENLPLSFPDFLGDSLDSPY
jgi:hypothetical protein